MNRKTVTVEKRVRLSHSALWQFQSTYYASQGIEAWVKQVPYFITSNPFVAKRYAQMIVGYMLDCGKDTPVTLFEMGAGSGKFTHYLLQELVAQMPQGYQFHYIMSDFAERNITFWQQQPQLKAWADQGLLTFAYFDCLLSTHIQCAQTRQALVPDGPMVCLANYVFDTLPQDAFMVQEGQLHASLITTKAPRDAVKGKVLERAEGLDMHFHHQRITHSYFKETHWNACLQDYETELGTGHFLVPTGGLGCLERVAAIATHGCLWLSTDKGYCDIAAMQHSHPPAIADHGSISTMVNYDFIARVIQRKGGHHVFQSPRPGISTCAFFLPPTPRLNHTHAHISQALEGFSVADYFQLHLALKQKDCPHTAASLLAYLCLSGWDPHILHQQHERLNQAISTMNTLERERLADAMSSVMARYYAMPDDVDTPCEAAMLLHNLKKYSEALPFYMQSMNQFGERFHIQYNIGCCYAYRGYKKEALTHLKRALEMQPDDEPCQQLIHAIETGTLGD